MSLDDSISSGAPQPLHDRQVLPSSALGWWGVGLTVLIFPLAATLMRHLIPWAILDTAFAPALLVVVLVAAAVTSVLAVVRKDRSIVTLLAAVVSSPLAAFGVFMAVLHVFFPD